MSDASGTLWLDVKKRQWSDEMLNLVDLNLNHMPELVEGTEPTGFLTNKIKYQLGFEKNIILAGGAGDQAAGAIGSGVIHSHQSVLAAYDAAISSLKKDDRLIIYGSFYTISEILRFIKFNKNNVVNL